MLTKFHKILLGLLGLQVVLAVVLLSRGGDAPAAKEQPLLPGFDVAKVTRIQVFTSPDGKPVDLAKRGSGWVVASSFDYPAASAKIDALLGPIAKVAAAEPIATQAARHKQLKVADTEFERKLVLTADGKDTTLFIGTPAGLRRNALRIGGHDDVFAVRDLSPYSAPAEPHMWVDQRYVSIPKEEIAKVSVKRATGAIELTHGEDGKWTATWDGGPLDPVDSEAIDTLVDQVAAIDLLSPADPKRDATHATTISIDLKTKPGVSAAPIEIDAIVDAKTIWVHQRAFDRAVDIDLSKLELLTVERAKLVKAPPPPAPPAPK